MNHAMLHKASSRSQQPINNYKHKGQQNKYGNYLTENNAVHYAAESVHHNRPHIYYTNYIHAFLKCQDFFALNRKVLNFVSLVNFIVIQVFEPR